MLIALQKLPAFVYKHGAKSGKILRPYEGMGMGQRRLNVPRIAQRLDEMNITLDGFKFDVQIDRRTVERLMSGKTRNAQHETVKIIANFLQLQPGDILLGASAHTGHESSAHHPVPDIEIRLPITGAHLVGRDQELVRLDRTWSCEQANILSIVAWGGVGKSALVNHWLGTVAHDGWRGAARVFGWTFSSQGIRESVTSADEFMHAALRFCGDPEPQMGTPWDKGQRLARLLSAKRTLLLLDGLEPLQHPPGPQAGKVKDPALATLLQALALHNPGLCIITTRLVVADIAAFYTTTAPVLSLEALSDEAGGTLLETLGVVGTAAECRTASREFAGHALALHLLGAYLCEACSGDVRRRREIAVLDDWSQEGGHAWRIMASYEQWFGQGPEVAVLRLLGLFERLASATEIAALRAVPPIPGLTEPLVSLSESQWMYALRRLRTAGLLVPPDPNIPQALDAHPLVREYYRHQLRTQYPAAWRVGHARLAAYLQASVGDACPATLDGLLPLYEAVTHACLAGCAPEALDVFRHRIRRGDQQFSVEQLGAWGIDLVALAQFFSVPWSAVIPDVQVDDRRFLLQAAGECLSTLGRMDEALTPLQQALELAHAHNSWSSAALAATRLSEAYRAHGDLPTALRFAERGATYVRYPDVPVQVQVLSHAFLGFALYWVGQLDAALTAFQEAERLQQRTNPARPLLHAALGYMYCELLLDQLTSEVASLTLPQFTQAWHALRTRIAQTLAWAYQDGRACDIGLQHISMGRVHILAWHHTGTIESRAATVQEQATMHVTRAVEYLHSSDHKNYFPRALLARAALYRVQGNFALAHQDINAVLDIVQSTGMEFYQADAYLEKAVLHLAAYQATPHIDDYHDATVSLDTAKNFINKMGYHRRWRQVMELNAIVSRTA